MVVHVVAGLAADRDAARRLDEAGASLGADDQRWQMSRVDEVDRQVGRDDGVDQRREALEVRAVDESVEPVGDLGRRHALERVGAQAVPQLGHQRGGFEAVAGHVAQDDAHAAVAERDHVVPVAADVGSRRDVADGRAHRPQVGHLSGQQRALEGFRDAALAFVDARVLDRNRAPLGRELEQRDLVLAEGALGARADVQNTQHLAAHHQRDADHGLDAGAAQRRADDVLMRAFADDDQALLGGDAAGEPAPDCDARADLALRGAACRAHDQRLAVFVEQEHGRVLDGQGRADA